MSTVKRIGSALLVVLVLGLVLATCAVLAHITYCEPHGVNDSAACKTETP